MAPLPLRYVLCVKFNVFIGNPVVLILARLKPLVSIQIYPWVCPISEDNFWIGNLDCCFLPKGHYWDDEEVGVPILCV